MSSLQSPLGTAPAVNGPHPMVAPFNIINREEALMYVTKVEDRFGNTLTYNWNGNDLVSIVASDGRELDFSYGLSTPLVSTITLKSAGGAHARTWTYSYNTSGAAPTLTRLQLPDGSAWTYSLGSLQMAAFDTSFQNGSCPGTGQLDISGGGPATGNITAPSGLNAAFTVQAMLHGRSYVPQTCIGVPGQPANRGIPAIPDQYYQFSLTQEVLTGPGIPAETWTYSYSPPNQSRSSDPCASSNSCPSTVYTDVTDPDGYDTRYTYSNRFDASEQELLSTTDYSGGSGSAALRSTVNTYANPTGGPWPTSYGLDLQSRNNHAQNEELSPLQKRVVSQDGTTFTTTVNSFDPFARATSETSSSSLGYSKSDTTSYQDDTNLWVLGLVTGTATNGIASAQTDYDGLDRPIHSYAFGKLAATRAWNADGTLASIADGDNHTTTFSNWYRGVPQSISYADGTSESAVVNGNGWITSVTDENGYTTNYGYDPMGRITSIAYPGGDDVAWNGTTFLYQQVGGSEFGIPAGHWREIVTTGNDTAITYFDAFWRPLVTEHYDAGNVAATLSQTVERYDAGGRKVFVSYPLNNLSDYSATSLTGTHTSYDALDRVTQVTQDSELGALSTTTAYLSGFQTQVTDPRGYATTTRYLAYGEPTRDWPVSITAPQGELTTIQRDVFGKPLSITRSGTSGSPSLTRSYAYDAYQELCGLAEPETGTTAFGYDGADNLVWSAAGLAALSGSCYTQSQAASSGREVTRTYDKRNRLLTITWPDGSSNASFGYYPDGALASQTAANGGNPVSTTYTYDKRRLLTGESLSIPGTSTFALGYGYDANGHLASTVYPDGRSIAYAPNALGQPTQAGAYATGVTYYPDGAIASYTYGNGLVHTMTENTRGLVSRSTDSYGGSAVHDDGYDYDSDGNVAAITDYLPGNVGNRDMTYDALDRLTQAVSPMFGSGSEDVAAYQYDVLDNLLSARVGSGTGFNYSYNTANQLTGLIDPASGTTLVSYAYDAQGNLAGKNGQAYQFDMANRLRNVPNVASYLYDAAGRRVQKTEAVYGNLLDEDYSKAGQLMFQWQPATQNATDYIYLGSTLVTRVVGNNSQVIGWVNGVTTADPPAVWGWACSTGIVQSINVEVFAGGPSGGGGTRIATATADLASGSDVAQACQTNGTAYAFSIPLSSTIRAQYGGQAIYMYGDSPVGNGNNELSGSGQYTVPPNPSAPPAPASINVPSSSNTGSVSVSWSPSSTASGYVLQQQFNGGSWTQVYSGAATSTSLSGLGNGSYVYRVQACNSVGCSPFTTSGTLSVALIPAPPASISVPASSYTASFGVSWSASANATSYVLDQNANGGGWSYVSTINGTGTTVTVPASGNYQYQVAACGAGGCSGYTASGTVAVTLPPASAPALSGPSSSTTGTFTLTWNTVAGATRYQLNQNLNGTVSVVYNASGTSWSSSNLGNGTYYYEVYACNVAGCAGSNVIAVSVLHVPAAPGSVTAPALATVNVEFGVQWGAVSGATSYNLRQTESGTRNKVATVYSGPDTSAGITLLGIVDDDFQYAAQACNSAGCSGWTNATNTTYLTRNGTPDAAPAAGSSVP